MNILGFWICLPRRTGIQGMWEWQFGRSYGSWLFHEGKVMNFVVRREEKE